MPSPVQLSAVDPPFPVFFSDERIMNPRIVVGSPMHEIIHGGLLGREVVAAHEVVGAVYVYFGIRHPCHSFLT